MERDLASGNDYDHARSHAPGSGRFLSPDKLGGRASNPQGWNRYTYAANNPLKFLDPNGKAAVGFIGWMNRPGGITQMVGQVNGAAGVGEARAFRHQDVDKAVKFLADQHKANPNDAVVVFGHSLGAASAVETAEKLGKQGIKVNLVVTIDPVFSNKTVSSNVEQATNYFERQDSTLPGTQVTAASSSTAVENIEMQGVKHTDIDDVLAASGTVANQIKDVGLQQIAATCGTPEFVGPCPR